MKKYAAVLLCLLCLTGCVGEGDDMPTAPVPEHAAEIPEDEIACVAPIVPTDPATMSGAPNLSVFCGGAEALAMNGGLSWVTTMPDGTAAVICADALHPLEMQKYLSVLETAQDTAGLAFWDGETQVWPEEIHVEARDFACTPDCDGLPTEVETYSAGEMVQLLPGKYISSIPDGATEKLPAAGSPMCLRRSGCILMMSKLWYAPALAPPLAGELSAKLTEGVKRWQKSYKKE